MYCKYLNILQNIASLVIGDAESLWFGSIFGGFTISFVNGSGLNSAVGSTFSMALDLVFCRQHLLQFTKLVIKFGTWTFEFIVVLLKVFLF